MPELITLADVLAARERIQPAAVRTPLVQLEPQHLAAVARQVGIAIPSPTAPLLLKNEAAQPIGSFKLRGAYNNIAALAERDPEALRRGVITYSSGNHAQGVAYAARALGTRAVIVMPSNAPEVKRQATAALGAEIVTVGPASSERKQNAEELVARHGYAMVPPYDDPFIIAGQATCGLEIFEQLHSLAAANAAHTLVLSPVSGGGLLSGIATGLKLAAEAAGSTPPQVWGCEPALAADAHESFYSKRLVEWPAAHTARTLADGLRTQSLGERNFAHILRFVDGIVTVTEDEIRLATRLILAATDIVAEPSGAVTLAAALFHASALPHASQIVAVVSGGNMDPALRSTLERENAIRPAGIHV
jgi:threonine dehydratase